MSRIELNFVATGNFTQLKTQIDQIRRSVEQINKSSMGVGMSNEQMSRMKQMAAQYDRIVQSSGAFHRSVVQTQTVTERFGQALQNQTLKLGQYFDAVKRGSNNTTGSLRQLAEQQVRLSQSMMRTDPFVSGRVYVDTPKKINAVTNATAIAKKQQELFNLAVRNGANELINWGKNTQWAGRQLSVGLTLPIVMFGKQASEVFLQFDKEMVRMQKVYGTGLVAASDSVIQGIRSDVTKLASEIASSWGQSISTTAAMAADLAATGLEGNKLTAATKEASRIAILGEVDRQAAIKTTVAMQNVFKLSNKDLTESFDYLIAVSNQTSLSLQDLTDAIPRAAPIVDELGGSYKDLAAMMAAMVEAGIPAAEAANAIKSSVASLINPTKETRKQLKELGIDIVGLVDQTRGSPVATFQLLATEMQKLDQLSRARAIEQIFGKFQFARIAALLDNINSKGTQTARVFDLMKASSGELANLAESNMKRVTESVSVKYQRAIASLQDSLRPIGETFTEVFTSLMQFFTKITNFVNEHPALLKFITYLGGFTAIIGPVVMLSGLFGNFFGMIGKQLITVKNLMNGFKSFGKVATAETLAASNASELFNEKMLKEAGSIDAVKVALSRLNTELQEYINLSTASKAGLAIAPAGAAPTTGYMGPAAIAASQAAAVAALGLGGSSAGYGRYIKGAGAAEWTHITPRSAIAPAFEQSSIIGQLKNPKKAAEFMPTTGVYITESARVLQRDLREFHKVQTITMSEAEASLKRADIFIKQATAAGFDPLTIKSALANTAALEQLYPSSVTLRNTHARFIAALQVLAEATTGQIQASDATIQSVGKMIDNLANKDPAKRAAAAQKLFTSVEQLAGGSKQFEARISAIFTRLIAETDDVKRQLMMAEMSAQASFATRNIGGRSFAPMKDIFTSDAVRGRYLSTMMGAQPSQMPDDKLIVQQLKAERQKLLTQIQQEEALQASILTQKKAQIATTQQELDLATQRVASFTGQATQNVQIISAINAGGTLYAKALVNGSEQLIALDAKGNALKNGIIGYANSLFSSIETQRVLDTQVLQLAESIDGYETSVREERAIRQKLMSSLRRQGVALDERNALYAALTQEELQSTQKYIVSQNAAGARIIQLIDSQGRLVTAYDLDAQKRLSSAEQSEIQRERINSSIAKQKIQYDKLSARLSATEVQMAGLDPSQKNYVQRVNALSAKIDSLRAQMAPLDVAIKENVISLSQLDAAIHEETAARVFGAYGASISGKIQLDAAQKEALIQSVKSQLTTEQIASIRQVEVLQRRDGTLIARISAARGQLIAALEIETGAVTQASRASLMMSAAATKVSGFFKSSNFTMGTMMGGMGLSMAGMAKGNNTMMYGGMALSMLPMLAMMSGPMIALTAAVAAVGFAIYKLLEYLQQFTDLQTAASTALSINTIAMNNFGIQTKSVSQATSLLTDQTKESIGEVDKLAEAYQNAGDEATKTFLKKIKEVDPATATKILVDRYRSDLVAGLTAEQAKIDIAAILKQTKRSDIVVDVNLKIKDIKVDGQKGAFNDLLKDKMSSYMQSKAAYNKALEAGTGPQFREALQNGDILAGALTAFTKSGLGEGVAGVLKNGPDIFGFKEMGQQMSDFQEKNRALEGDLKNVGETMALAFQTMPLKELNSSIKELFPSAQEFLSLTEDQKIATKEQFDAIVSKIRETDPVMADNIQTIKDMGYNYEKTMQLANLMFNGVNLDFEELKRNWAEPTYVDFIVRTTVQGQSLDRLAEGMQQYFNKGTGPESSTDTGTTTQEDQVAKLKEQFALEDKRAAQDKAIEDRYTKLNDAQQKIIDNINKERDARRKLKEEQQANNEFMLTEMGLKKQIAEAAASGDLLGAAMLQQQLQNEQDKKAADDKEKRITAVEDAKIKAAEDEKKRLDKQKNAEIKALEAVRKAEDRNKQIADAAKNASDAATNSAEAQQSQFSEAGSTARTILQQIQDKMNFVYFSTPEEALKDSTIAKLTKQLIDMGVPANEVNKAIADMLLQATGDFDSSKFDALVKSLKNSASEAAILTIVLGAQNYMQKQGYTVDLAVSQSMKDWYGGNARAIEQHQDVFTAVRNSIDPSFNPAARADGGPISGPGGPRDDRIPAMLSNGEYVVKADAVSHYGAGFFDAVNSKKFADGGPVNNSINKTSSGRWPSPSRLVARIKSYGINPKLLPEWDNRSIMSAHMGTDGDARYVIMHDTGGLGEGLVDWVQNDGRFSYKVKPAHALIMKDGRVFISYAWPTYHAGKGGPYGSVRKNSMNNYSYGIEHESLDASKDFSRREIISGATVAAAMLDIMGQPTSHAINHRTWAPSRKVDTFYTDAFWHETIDSIRNHTTTPTSPRAGAAGSRRIPTSDNYKDRFIRNAKLVKLLYDTGFRNDDLRIAYGVAWGESNGDRMSKHFNKANPSRGMPEDSTDWGLMQINDFANTTVKGFGRVNFGSKIFDAIYNSMVALKIKKERDTWKDYQYNGWKDWNSYRYNSDAYREGIGMFDNHPEWKSNAARTPDSRFKWVRDRRSPATGGATSGRPPQSKPKANTWFAPIMTGTADLTSDVSPMARNITSTYGMGGYVMPTYHTGGKVGYAKGGEVAALLQSGETVLTTNLTDKLTPLLESIADGKMGIGDINNTIVINGVNKSPDQIADLVVQKISRSMSKSIRTNRVL